jgi:F0F1-type ATP synthase gamma subunit
MNTLADFPTAQLAEQIEHREPAATSPFRRTVGIMTHDGVATEEDQSIRVHVYKHDTDRVDLTVARGQLYVTTFVSGAMARALAAELVAAADAMDAAAGARR